MATNRKLGRTTDIRLAMLKTQVTDLLWHGKIETTVTRAKETKAIADSLIALAVKEAGNFEEVEVKVSKAKLDEKGNPIVNFYTDKIHKRCGYKWTHPVHEVLKYNKDYENIYTKEKKPGIQIQKFDRLIVEGLIENDVNVICYTSIPASSVVLDNIFLKVKNHDRFKYSFCINIPIIKDIYVVIAVFFRLLFSSFDLFKASFSSSESKSKSP